MRLSTADDSVSSLKSVNALSYISSNFFYFWLNMSTRALTIFSYTFCHLGSPRNRPGLHCFYRGSQWVWILCSFLVHHFLPHASLAWFWQRIWNTRGRYGLTVWFETLDLQEEVAGLRFVSISLYWIICNIKEIIHKQNKNIIDDNAKFYR